MTNNLKAVSRCLGALRAAESKQTGYEVKPPITAHIGISMLRHTCSVTINKDQWRLKQPLCYFTFVLQSPLISYSSYFPNQLQYTGKNKHSVQHWHLCFTDACKKLCFFYYHQFSPHLPEGWSSSSLSLSSAGGPFRKKLLSHEKCPNSWLLYPSAALLVPDHRGFN